MRVLNTLFNHQVYSGIHKVFKEACSSAGITYIVCDDPKHTGVKIGNSNVIAKFNYRLDGKKIHLDKDDVVITRSVFNTLQPLQFIATGRKFFISEESWGEKPVKRKFYSMLGKTLFKKVPFITQTLKSTKFLESFGLKCFHLPPFIKPDFNLSKGKHILYVARMEEIKNPDLVVELAKRMPDQKFVFVATLGQKDILERIKLAASPLQNVQFFERIPYEKLLQLYKDAKLLLLPTSADPIGYCVIEALSFAVPVITTKYAGTADYLDKGWVLDDFDPATWERKIRDVLKDETKSRKLAKDLFIKNNIELDGAYFKKMANELAEYLSSTIQNSK